MVATLSSVAAHAEIRSARVVGISDGDTITVLARRQQVKVRINGIDAPEKRQAFGERSKQNLSAMAFGKDARLECHKTDRYGRQVCKVWVQPGDCPSCGLTLDIGHAQVIAEMAWWYCKYGPSGITTVAMDGRDAVLEPVDVEQPLLQIHHIPAQGDQFRYTQPMAIREQ